MREQILFYALRYHGEWQRITKAIAQQEPWDYVNYEGAYITIVEDHYPVQFRKLQYAPWIIFYEGDLSLLQEHAVSIVGARECNLYGLSMCRHVCHLLKKRSAIISGLARGIDACAHQEALDAKTIAVIGCGLNVPYPKENAWLYDRLKASHLILSEYPNGCKPFAHHFPWRNRLIAALSEAVVVIQAKKHSGTLLTVNEAIELDIPVYCIPHPFMDGFGDGCNLLISQGANILVDDDDILAIL